MKILVIDDTQKHLDAALQSLINHDVTTCSSHDEALKLLEEKYDNEKKAGLRKKYEESGMDLMDAIGKAKEESVLPYWDAVLCDLLMPAGRDAQGEGRRFVGQEMPLGWSLALTAAMRGTKYVAVATDMNHHAHPASAMLDRIKEHIFTIDNTQLLMTNEVGEVNLKGTEHTCGECGGTGKMKRDDGSEYRCSDCKDGVAFEKGKDWNNILDKFLKTNPESK